MLLYTDVYHQGYEPYTVSPVSSTMQNPVCTYLRDGLREKVMIVRHIHPILTSYSHLQTAECSLMYCNRFFLVQILYHQSGFYTDSAIFRTVLCNVYMVRSVRRGPKNIPDRDGHMWLAINCGVSKMAANTAFAIFLWCTWAIVQAYEPEAPIQWIL